MTESHIIPALFMPTLRECIFDIMGEKW